MMTKKINLKQMRTLFPDPSLITKNEIQFDGWVLEDASLDDLAHYFEYTADRYAETYL